jgi:hypothetical protein
MDDATPFRCRYASLLEALVFSSMQNDNIVIYAPGETDTTLRKLIEYSVEGNKQAKTICLLYDENHYQAILPPQQTANDNVVDTTMSFRCTNSVNETNKDWYYARSFVNKKEVDDIVCHLKGMALNDLKELYSTVAQKLTKRNGYVVDYNPTLTAILGCHTNALLLGSSEQSKVAAHYVGPYVDKYKTDLVEALDIVYESMEHVKVHPSIAQDTGSTTRYAQHTLTRILNKLGSLREISDVQAAAALLKLKVSVCSEFFTVLDTEACINMIRNEQTIKRITSTAQDERSEDSTDNTSSDADFSNDDSSSECSHSATDDEWDDDNSDTIVVSDDFSEASMLQHIKEHFDKLRNNKDFHLQSPKMKFYSSAYGSSPLYTVDDGKRIVAVPYTYLYRYRGKRLKDLNRLEYFSLITVQKDRKEDLSNEKPHLQYKSGSKPSTWYRFDKGIEIHADHHQTLRSRQCTPKFFKHSPMHPGKKPEQDGNNEKDIKLWTKKADKFAEFYLTLFRPEADLYADSQPNDYGYKWGDLVQFVNSLKANYDVAISRFRLDYMNSMINSLVTCRRNRTILCDY